MGFLIIGLGALAVWALTKGSSSSRAPAPGPIVQPTVPAPAPRGNHVVVIPDQPAIMPSAESMTHDGGVISPASEPGMGPRAVEEIPPQDIPPELLPIVQQASSASEADLEAAALNADELGYPDIADWLRARAQRRREYARAQREGVAPAPRRDSPVQAQSYQPEALPAASADRAELSRLATRLADNIRRSRYRGYDRALLVRFQTAAGLLADGKYGSQSARALGTYGHLPAGQIPEPQY